MGKTFIPWGTTFVLVKYLAQNVMVLLSLEYESGQRRYKWITRTLTDLGGFSFPLGWFSWENIILLQCPGLECCSGEQHCHSGAPLPISEDV